MLSHPPTDCRGVLFRGGSIVTVDPRRPQAEAVATRDGRILAVGSELDCRRALGLDAASGTTGTAGSGGPTTGHSRGNGTNGAHGTNEVTVVDLAGGALLPGFIDAHLHPMAMCFYTYNLDLAAARSIDDVLDALSDRANATPPGDWVVGLNVDAEQIAEHRLPALTELDKVSAGHALVCLARDGHTSVGNSIALAAAGIRPGRTDPPGGAFERDGERRLTGVCRETATQLLMSAVPVLDLDQVRSSAHQVFDHLASQGITSVGLILQTDAEGPGGFAGALESVGMMIFANDLLLGSHAILCGEPRRTLDARRSSDLHAPDKNRVVGGVKLFFDGTLGSRSACLHHPYSDAPHEHGWLTVDPQVAAARMETSHLAGLQICVHAIGDAANSLALDLFEELLTRHPVDGNGPRHRIEHASVLDERSVERFAQLGLVAVVQPPFLRNDAPWLPDRLGDERLTRTYAFRSLLDAGVTLAGSSDAPVEPTDVLDGIAVAVDRGGFVPQEAITAKEAVTMYTRGAAIAQQREHITGSITEGHRADLVVLSDDPTAVPSDQIADIDVLLTVVGGQVVHRAPSTVPT
jgi:predicted amidohydrolase YtcJ